MKKLLLAMLTVAVFSHEAMAAGEGHVLHKFGRKDAVDMLGAKVYDSNGVLQLGATGTTAQSLASGDVLVPGNLEVQTKAYNASGQLKSALLSKTAATNWNVTTKGALYTCPTSKKCYVTQVLFSGASGTSGTASCGIGWDTGATNVSAAATHAITATTYMLPTIATVPTFGNAGDVLGIKCGTPEGSALTVDVSVFGYVE